MLVKKGMNACRGRERSRIMQLSSSEEEISQYGNNERTQNFFVEILSVYIKINLLLVQTKAKYNYRTTLKFEDDAFLNINCVTKFIFIYSNPMFYVIPTHQYLQTD